MRLSKAGATLGIETIWMQCQTSSAAPHLQPDLLNKAAGQSSYNTCLMIVLRLPPGLHWNSDLGGGSAVGKAVTLMKV